MIDLSKAFDMLDHSIFLTKLISLRISGLPLSWIKSYLENRMQCTKIGSSLSSPSVIKCGVPQGSILGPLLCITYINDISERTKLRNLYLYADDCACVFKSSRLRDSFIEASHTLPILAQYFQREQIYIKHIQN